MFDFRRHTIKAISKDKKLMKNVDIEMYDTFDEETVQSMFYDDDMIRPNNLSLQQLEYIYDISVNPREKILLSYLNEEDIKMKVKLIPRNFIDRKIQLFETYGFAQQTVYFENYMTIDNYTLNCTFVALIYDRDTNISLSRTSIRTSTLKHPKKNRMTQCAIVDILPNPFIKDNHLLDTIFIDSIKLTLLTLHDVTSLYQYETMLISADDDQQLKLKTLGFKYVTNTDNGEGKRRVMFRPI